MNFLTWLKKKKILWPIIIFFLGCWFFVLLLFTKESRAPEVAKETEVKVQVLKGQLLAYSPELQLYGRVETPYTSHLKSGISGYIRALYFQEGDYFNTGDILLSIDPKDVNLLLLQKRAQADNLKARIEEEKLEHQRDQQSLVHEQELLQLSQKNLARENTLLDKELVSPQRVDALKESVAKQQIALVGKKHLVESHTARLRQLTAQYEQARAEEKIAMLDVERAAIKAPFAGRVARLNVSVGERVERNTSLINIYATGRLEVRVQLPFDQMAEIKQSLAKQEPILARFNYHGRNYQLTLDRLSGEIQGSTAGTDGLFRFNPGMDTKNLPIGETLSLTVILSERPNLLALPTSALYALNRIFIIENGRLKSIAVTVRGYMKQDQQEMVLLTSMYNLNDQVIVTSHLPNAIDGLKVRWDQQP